MLSEKLWLIRQSEGTVLGLKMTRLIRQCRNSGQWTRRQELLLLVPFTARDGWDEWEDPRLVPASGQIC
jgi:hypothetical protein